MLVRTLRWEFHVNRNLVVRDLLYFVSGFFLQRCFLVHVQISGLFVECFWMISNPEFDKCQLLLLNSLPIVRWPQFSKCWVPCAILLKQRCFLVHARKTEQFVECFWIIPNSKFNNQLPLLTILPIVRGPQSIFSKCWVFVPVYFCRDGFWCMSRYPNYSSNVFEWYTTLSSIRVNYNN